MKKNVLLIFVVLLLFFVNLTAINAENAGGVTGNDNPGEDSNKGSENYKWVYSGESYYNGLKVTVYKKDGTYVGTKAFLNNKDEVKTLNGATVYVTDSTRRLTSSGTDRNIWTDASSTYFQYLYYPDFFRSTVDVDLLSFFRAADDATLIADLGLRMVANGDLKNYVLVIEPAIVTINKSSTISKIGYHFGTFWEYKYFYKTAGGVEQDVNSSWTRGTENDFSWVLGNVFRDLGKSISISAGEINSQSKPLIWEFLSNSKFNTFRSNVGTKQSLGVAIVAVKDVVEMPDPTEKSCTTTITKGSCSSDYSIKESTDRDCVVNNQKYKYSSVGDCGTIYCSEDISTDLNNFYSTFTPIIRSGSYFKMNSIKVDVTRTCYLVSRSNSTICNNWHNNITEETAGTVKLTLVSDYTLVKDGNTSTFNVTCDSYFNGKCTKAIATQHIEYVLEPNTNRYISIKDMAGTGTASGNDIYDLGGEHLTTPISLSTGKHNYTVNYQSTNVLFDSIGRLTNQTITLNEQDLILNYSYNQSLTSGDLTYSCEYEAKQKDPPPCECLAECCDLECNPVECPPPDDPPGFPNIIYRPINLEEAFPGQDGTGRDFGDNWDGYVYDSSGNTINKPNGTPYTKEEYYVNFNRGYDDYDVYQANPLYVIRLDYDALKEIREYNDATGHDYNDFTLTCTNGEKCISNFLRGNVSGFNRNLITGGTCKNINSTSFNSCITRIGA